MKLIIEDDEGRKTVVPVVRDEITIGRQDGNTIKLTERNVSRRHARLWKSDGSLLIEDLGSYNGVRVNGDKIEGPTAIREGDLVEIGDYDLGIQGKLEPTPKGAPAATRSTIPPKSTPVPAPPAAPAPVAAAPAPAPAPAPVPAPAPAQAAAPPPEVEEVTAPTPHGATAIINVHKLMGAGAPDIEVRDLSKAEMPRLVGLAGQFRAKEFYLMRTEWKIGRTEENDLAIDHQSISRQHCKFVFDGTDWKIYDNKSANGVKVNGEEYAVAPVKAGDNVELGHVKFRFCGPGEKFTAPPEKTETPPMGSGKPPPTTAELIAGAQGRGPSAMKSAPAKKSSSMPLIIGGVVVVAAIAVVAFVVLGKRGGETDGNGHPTGESALKAAHAAADKKDFRSACELAGAAGAAAPSSFKKKMCDEAAAQEASERFDAALASDPDKAKIEFDRCSSEDTFYCAKVKEKEDAFKASFAKKHLAIASANKGTNPTVCSEEVGKVLALEPGNAEAQTISQQCSPQQQVATPRPPPQPAGPSQKDRDAQANELSTKGTAEAHEHDYDGAIKDLTACVDKKPSLTILQTCWRNLGVVYISQGNYPEAAKWLKKFQPYCKPAECDTIAKLIAKGGG